MITFEDKIKKDMLKLSSSYQIIQESDIVLKISKKFDWVGSKLNWNKTQKHIYSKIDNNSLLSIKEFIDFNNGIRNAIIESKDMYYINDSSINFAVLLKSSQFDEWLEFAYNNMPQHHYFYDSVANWILVITMEGNIDFGYSIK